MQMRSYFIVLRTCGKAVPHRSRLLRNHFKGCGTAVPHLGSRQRRSFGCLAGQVKAAPKITQVRLHANAFLFHCASISNKTTAPKITQVTGSAVKTLSRAEWKVSFLKRQLKLSFVCFFSLGERFCFTHRVADDGKRSEDSQSSGVERFLFEAAVEAFFCFFSLGGRSRSIKRVADIWFMKQHNIKTEVPRCQNE